MAQNPLIIAGSSTQKKRRDLAAAAFDIGVYQ
jgi:hypothetical protein